MDFPVFVSYDRIYIDAIKISELFTESLCGILLPR